MPILFEQPQCSSKKLSKENSAGEKRKWNRSITYEGRFPDTFDQYCLRLKEEADRSRSTETTDTSDTLSWEKITEGIWGDLLETLQADKNEEEKKKRSHPTTIAQDLCTDATSLPREHATLETPESSSKAETSKPTAPEHQEASSSTLVENALGERQKRKRWVDSPAEERDKGLNMPAHDENAEDMGVDEPDPSPRPRKVQQTTAIGDTRPKKERAAVELPVTDATSSTTVTRTNSVEPSGVAAAPSPVYVPEPHAEAPGTTLTINPTARSTSTPLSILLYKALGAVSLSDHPDDSTHSPEGIRIVPALSWPTATQSSKALKGVSLSDHHDGSNHSPEVTRIVNALSCPIAQKTRQELLQMASVLREAAAELGSELRLQLREQKESR